MITRYLRPVLALSAATTALLAQDPGQPVAANTSQASAPAAGPGGSVAGLVTRPEEQFPELNLPSTPLNMVVLPIEELTGRTVLRQQGLPNPEITLVFRASPTRAEAMQALETVLNLNQIALIPLGTKFIKMIPMPSVRMEAPELIDGSTLGLPPSGRVASKLFRLNFLQVNEFIPQVAPLLNANIGNYATFDKANSVLVTDSIANLQRIETLVEKIDAPLIKHLAPRFYQLRNAKASDLVNKLRTILQGPLQTQLSTSTTYSPDDRTNQIVLISDERQFALFDDLIHKLDVNADPNTRNEVIYLKHASSKDVATLLSTVVSGQNKAIQAENASVRGGIANSAQQTPQGPQPQPQAPVNAGPAVTAPSVEGSSATFSEFITIQADERSNALILAGPIDDIRMLKALIDKLDVVLPQVMIEVVIVEVTLSDGSSSGLQSLGLTVKEANGKTAITSAFGSVAGFGFGGATDANGATTGAAIIDPLSFTAVMSTIGTKLNARVLQKPIIMTMHNKEGVVSVGEKRPLVTGTTSTPISTGTALSSGFAQQQQVSYTNIATELKVTPLIGEDGSIQLKVDQKVEDAPGSVEINGNPQPIISTRQATSYVNVQDGGVIVLGGLQRTNTSRSRNKVGLFYEIPIISQLLGSRKRDESRTELLLFIRPKVVRMEDAAKDAEDRINQLRDKNAVRQYLEDSQAEIKDPIIEKIK